MDTDLQGRTALVVGGSGGIGREVAIRLAARGASVIVHGHRAARVTELVAELPGPGRHRGHSANLSGGAAPDAFAELLDRAGTPDLLIHAFGPETHRRLTDLNPTDWISAAITNLVLPGMAISAVLPAMIERNWGRIVLFGATGTERIRGFREDPAYGAAKTALSSLVRSADLAAENRDVAVNCIAPGYVDTEYRHWGRGLSAGAVADVANWLCPAAPAWVRGSVIPVPSRGVSV